MRSWKVLLVCALATSGCSLISIDGGRVERVHLGVLRIASTGYEPVIAYRITGIGLIPGATGFSVGYSHQEVVLSSEPERCQVIVFDPPVNAIEVDRWLAAIKTIASLCNIGGLPK